MRLLPTRRFKREASARARNDQPRSINSKRETEAAFPPRARGSAINQQGGGGVFTSDSSFEPGRYELVIFPDSKWCVAANRIALAIVPGLSTTLL
jgi:hypothetical protein